MADMTCQNLRCAEVSPALSCQLTIRRSGEHIAKIAQNLRDLERMMMGVAWQGDAAPQGSDALRRPGLQSLDLLIQELAGLSDILIGAASRLPDVPDSHVDALVDLPRLQSLSCALRGQVAKEAASETVIF